MPVQRAAESSRAAVLDILSFFMDILFLYAFRILPGGSKTGILCMFPVEIFSAQWQQNRKNPGRAGKQRAEW